MRGFLIHPVPAAHPWTHPHRRGQAGWPNPSALPRDQLLIRAPRNSQHTAAPPPLCRCLTKQGGSRSCAVTGQDEPPQPDQPPPLPRYLPGTIRGLVTAAGWPQSLPAVPAALLVSYSPVPRVPQEHRPCQPGVQTEHRGTPPVRPGCPACGAGDAARAPHGSPGDSLGARAWVRTAGGREGTLNPPWLHVTEWRDRQAAAD